MITLLLAATAYLMMVYVLLAFAQRTTKVSPAPSRNAR